jgi:hypothetical protein
MSSHYVSDDCRPAHQRHSACSTRKLVSQFRSHAIKHAEPMTRENLLAPS